MQQYLDLVKLVLSEGHYKKGTRTGIDTITVADEIPGYGTFYLKEGLPLVTTKKMAPKMAIDELLWFISGNDHLRDHPLAAKIWMPWVLDQKTLYTGPLYPVQWRRQKGVKWETDEIVITDQLQRAIDIMGEDPSDRRMVISSWNPAQLDEMALYPCHHEIVFSVTGGKITGALTQRSADIAVGVPYNIAEYAILINLMSHLTGYEPGTLRHTIVDGHIYCGNGKRAEFYRRNLGQLQDAMREADSTTDYQGILDWIIKEAPPERPGEEGFDHIPGLLTQLQRTPGKLSRLEVMGDIQDVNDFSHENIKVRGYKGQDKIFFRAAI